MFREAWVDKVPERTTHQPWMTTDDCPELVHTATCITCYRQILVHERRTWVFRLRHHRCVHLQFVRGRVARADDVFARMSVCVTAIHEVARWIEALAFLHHFRDEGTFAALVTCTPEQHAGVVAVAQHQFLYTLQVHPAELLVVRDKFRCVSLSTSLVDDIQSILVGKFQIPVHRRIVRGAYSIEVVLFQYLHILADGLLVHGVSQFRVLHVRIDGTYLDGLSVEEECLMSDFRLLESHLAADLLHHLASLVQQFQFQGVEGRCLTGPLVRVRYLCR